MIAQSIYQHLVKQAALEPFLATYNGKLAIFNQEAPDDQDRGWDGSQYGRIMFSIDMQDDPERNVSGVMAVDVICRNGKQVPEDIEPVVRDLIDGYFFSDEIETVAVQWSASNYFDEIKERICGVTLSFDILAFPQQQTFEPDPISCLNDWTKQVVPDATIIGKDTLQPVYKPLTQNPAIYWRLVQIGPCNYIGDTWSCSWRTASIQAHIMAPDINTMEVISRSIEAYMANAKCILLADKSPLRIDRISTIPGSDPLRQGQLSVEATFGTMRTEKPVLKMNHINVNESTKEG